MAGNQDAVELMGDASLRLIAHELLTSRNGSVTVDRAHGERAQARMRSCSLRQTAYSQKWNSTAGPPPHPAVCPSAGQRLPGCYPKLPR